MYEMSSLLRSILDQNNASSISFTEKISDMTEDEKRNLFDKQKAIIIQYRQESYIQLQKKKETMQSLINKSRSVGIVVDETDINSSPDNLKATGILNVVPKVSTVPNISRLSDNSTVFTTQSNKQISIYQEAKLYKRKDDTNSPKKQYKQITPACFVAIDNKLKQINFEILALTRKQQMISRKLKK